MENAPRSLEMLGDDELLSRLLDMLREVNRREIDVSPLKPLLLSTAAPRWDWVETETVDPRQIESAFDHLIQHQIEQTEGRKGRKPSGHVERLYSVIQGRENEEIPIDDFACLHAEYSSNPAKARIWASNSLRKLNIMFREIGEPVSIQSTSPFAVGLGVTLYRLRALSADSALASK